MKNKAIKKVHMSPPLFLLASFALVIAIGTVLLNMPFSSANGEPVGWINAFFTASSATCVTGLVVVDTATHWTTIGQVVIITMIQIGGLGLMTFAVMFAMILKKNIGLSDRMIIKEQLNVDGMGGLVKLLKYIVMVTVAIEGIGAIILATKFIPIYGLKTGTWYSVFHAISAFCNAGFSTIVGSIEPYKADWVINITIMLLVIFGGLGFTVILEILERKRFKQFTVQGKIAIILSTALILIGAIGFFLLERTNTGTIANESTSTQWLQSFFQSVVARTAGFGSVDLSKMRDATTFLLIAIMIIGGSPGSTAGGFKTTTVAVLFFTTLSVIRGEKDTVIFNRKIGLEIVRKSLAIIMIGIFLILSIVFVLTITEDASFIDILYETVSAYATVGVSKGITENLTDIGKVILSLTMYTGRVGSLTMAFALGRKDRASKLNYAETNISVG